MEFVRNLRRSLKLFSSIDTSAFASILVVLVLILLVVESMSYNPHRSASVDLPRVLHPIAMAGAGREDAMLITVTRDGRAHFGSDQIDPVSLATRIQDRLKDREVERKVYIVADMRARWNTVKIVLDGVRSAGIIRVAFLVNQRRFPTLRQ